jgi:hypothetical protein
MSASAISTIAKVRSVIADLSVERAPHGVAELHDARRGPEHHQGD